jgi:hypothetical protein
MRTTTARYVTSARKNLMSGGAREEQMNKATIEEFLKTKYREDEPKR